MTRAASPGTRTPARNVHRNRRKTSPMLDANATWRLGIDRQDLALALLIIAFAVWGVADVFAGYGTRSLARIGSTEISADEFRQAYQDEMELDFAPARPPPHARAGQAARPRPARLVAADRRRPRSTPMRASSASPYPTAASPTIIRTRSRLQGPRPAASPAAAFNELPAPERLSPRAATSSDRRKERSARAAHRRAAGGSTPPQIRSIDSCIATARRQRIIDVRHARSRQARQDCRARRGQAQGVLRAEQAPVRDARKCASSTLLLLTTRGGQEARTRHRRGDPGGLRGGQGKLQHAREAAHLAALLSRYGGG